MKNLFLMRHAKSKWNENVSDQFRSITEIGEFKTKKVANYIHQNFELKFDQIFSSKAVRAKETSLLVKPILFPNQTIHIEDDNFTIFDFIKN